MADSEEKRIVLLKPLEELSPHERIIEERLRDLTERIDAAGTFNLPILVDADTGVILDGHHRYYALRNLGIKRIPVLQVNYREDPDIDLAPGPRCPLENLTRDDVLEMGQSGEVFPPKSTRHRVKFSYPSIDCSLEELRNPD